MASSIRERSEVFAVRIVVTHILAHLFRSDPKMVKRFAEDVQKTVDGFQFVDGWRPHDETQVREYMRVGVDNIVGPASRAAKR